MRTSRPPWSRRALSVFVFAGVARVNYGTYVSLLEKSADGTSRISHHFWNDLPHDGGL